MGKRATEDALSELHGALAQAMAAKVLDGSATASDLNVIRQFLKDNGINADAGSNDDIQNLSDSLPDDLDDENVYPIRNSR